MIFLNNPLISSLLILITFFLFVFLFNLYNKHKNFHSLIIKSLEKGHFEKALQLLNDHKLKLKPSFFYSYSILSLAKLKRYSEALSLESVALTESEVNEGLYDNLGYTYYKIGNYDSAIDYSNKALELNPNDVFALCNLGFSYFNQGNYEESHKLYKRSLEINENYIHALIGEAFYYYINDNYEKSICFFKKVTELSPSNDGYFRRLGECYFYLENLEASAKAYKKALSLNPKDLNYKCEYANILIYLGDLSLANSLLSDVLKSDPLNATAYYSKCRICSLLREKELSIFYLEKAICLNPSFKNLAKEDKCLNNLRFFEEFNKLLD